MSSRKRLDAVRELFDYWRQQCEHPQSRLTNDRRTKIHARLREGYSPADIRRAIDGAARKPYVDTDGKRFDDLELICRNGSKLEDFIARADLKTTGSVEAFDQAWAKKETNSE